jgi:hypothetical protein
MSFSPLPRFMRDLGVRRLTRRVGLSTCSDRKRACDNVRWRVSCDVREDTAIRLRNSSGTGSPS